LHGVQEVESSNLSSPTIFHFDRHHSLGMGLDCLD